MINESKNGVAPTFKFSLPKLSSIIKTTFFLVSSFSGVIVNTGLKIWSNSVSEKYLGLLKVSFLLKVFRMQKGVFNTKAEWFIAP